MALYQDDRYLIRGWHEAFDALFDGGTAAPHTGIYRCEECGREVVAAEGDPLPAADHYPHAGSPDDIGWRLIVATTH